jgi:hypothetical protein
MNIIVNKRVVRLASSREASALANGSIIVNVSLMIDMGPCRRE